jgi:pyridoxal phosphate enzyme (YggS family)
VHTTSSPIETRYRSIQRRIADAAEQNGRAPSDITLLAVSKRQPDVLVRQLAALGHRDFGENLVQEWRRKHADMVDLPTLEWHVIGPVQTNKAKFIARGKPSLVHTVDRASLISALEKRIDEAAVQRILLQVNIDNEAQKAGVAVEDLRELADKAAAAERLELAGLMCIPAAGTDTQRAFAKLRNLSEEIEDLCVGPMELSMGMSLDFESAIAEGATIVRVGSALFGPRDV